MPPSVCRMSTSTWAMNHILKQINVSLVKWKNLIVYDVAVDSLYPLASWQRPIFDSSNTPCPTAERDKVQSGICYIVYLAIKKNLNIFLSVDVIQNWKEIQQFRDCTEVFVVVLSHAPLNILLCAAISNLKFLLLPICLWFPQHTPHSPYFYVRCNTNLLVLVSCNWCGSCSQCSIEMLTIE